MKTERHVGGVYGRIHRYNNKSNSNGNGNGNSKGNSKGNGNGNDNIGYDRIIKKTNKGSRKRKMKNSIIQKKFGTLVKIKKKDEKTKKKRSI